MMTNRVDEALDIYNRPMAKKEKMRLLEELALDLHNELEAQDQNMHPEVYNELAEGLRVTTNFIRTLHDT